MNQSETPTWYKKLSTIVGTFENDPTYVANREAQAFGFCSRCKTPIDKDELGEMSKAQLMEYNIIGRCKKCQEEVRGPSCTEIISEFMNVLEREKANKNQVQKKDEDPRSPKNDTEKNDRKINSKKFDNENDIIDEDFL